MKNASSATPTVSAMHSSPIALTSRFNAAEKGSVASLLGLAAVPLVLALGLAVDSGLAYGTHSKLQGAVDAAALASARSATSEDGDVEADARMYFNANFPDGYLGTRITNFNAQYDERTGELTVDAKVEMPTSFMQVAGLSSTSIGASATAQKQLNGIELAMVLDVTGSMNRPDPSGGKKIDALKGASETLLDVIYGDKETVRDVSISVVPYNTEVNLGSGRTGFLADFDEEAFGDDGWKGCVEARSAPYDQDDTPPSEQPLTALLWPAGEGIDRNAEGDPNKMCPDSEVLPLTQKRSVISDHIDGLRPKGQTMTNVGFSWGWRTISPRWRTAWDITRVETGADDGDLAGIGGSSSATAAPVDYDHPTIEKAIIFMTDGIANWSPGYYTAYGFLEDGRLGGGNEKRAEAEINERLLTSCDLAKAEGIDVYTVMFALDDASIERDYRACASSEDHFFDAPDGEALDEAFRDIAGRLTSLRLTQ